MLPSALVDLLLRFFRSQTFNDPSGVMVMLGYEHHKAHQGRLLIGSYLVPNAAPIANDATLNILIRNQEHEQHFNFSVTAEGDAEMRFYEGAGYSNAGTAVPIYNLDRSSPWPARLQMSHTPTITAAGTLLASAFLPGGNKPTGSGGIISTPAEWHLLPNTGYVIAVTNRAGQAAQMSVGIQFYPEDYDDE